MRGVEVVPAKYGARLGHGAAGFTMPSNIGLIGEIPS